MSTEKRKRSENVHNNPQMVISDLNGFQTHDYWADQFRVDPETIRQWIRHYKIPHRRLKTKWLLRAGDIFEHAEKVYHEETPE